MVVSEHQELMWRLISANARARGGPMSVADVCAVCVRVLAVDGVGLSLLDGERLEPVHAEGELGRELLEAELTSGDGPCVEAALRGRPVSAPDLADPASGRRWPLFTATAQADGVAAAFAFPLMTAGARLGVLVACRSRPGPLEGRRYQDALILAEFAVTLLLNTQLDVRTGAYGGTDDDRETAEGDAAPADWLVLGAEVHQAAGMVSVQLGCTVEQALARLRAYAFSHDLPVTQVARQVVACTLRFTPDTTPWQ
ncbi:GAF and ANTAR domain-containing protein [Spirillospora sp. CA-253888]